MVGKAFSDYKLSPLSCISDVRSSRCPYVIEAQVSDKKIFFFHKSNRLKNNLSIPGGTLAPQSPGATFAPGTVSEKGC